ncbi:MAG: hypothetical protein ACLFPL_02110 [Candidatus Nanoarchaeia archaeon]
MIKFSKLILLGILLISLFSTSFALENTGNLILNGNFDQLETKNYLDIIVFVIVIALIVSILEQSLAKYVPIPQNAFRLLIVVFLISYFWILLTSFGGDALVFTLVWISIIGILAISVVVWNLVRQGEPIKSARSLYGVIAGYITYVILITATKGINAQGFENSTLMNAILLTSFGGGISTDNMGAVAAMIVLAGFGIFISRKTSNSSIESDKDVHSSISKHIKSENQQRTVFNRHYQALYDGINQLNKISYGKDPSTIDENTQNQQRSLVSLLYREVQELLKLASTEMKASKKKNKLGLSEVIVETNMYNNQQLIQYLSQIGAIINRFQRMNPLQVTNQELENINQIYSELNNVVSHIDNSIQQEIKNYTAIDQFVEKLKTEHLNRIESLLSEKKLKEFQTHSKPQILKIIVEQLVHSQDMNKTLHLIEESLGFMNSHYPTDKTQQSQIKVDKIKNLHETFKSSLLYDEIDKIQQFWASYWSSK